MPYLIATSLYPSDKAPEVGKKYLEAIQKYPVDENLGTPLVPAAVKQTDQGIKSISISEIKEGKLEGALNLAANRLAMFNEIVGFEYSIDVFFKVEEALATIGLSLPE